MSLERGAQQQRTPALCSPPAGLPTSAAAAEDWAEPGTPALGDSSAAGGRPGIGSSTSSEEFATYGGVEDAAAGEAVPLLASGVQPASQGLRRRQRQEGVR
ncbi:hypothetical protein ABPG75_011098 [Micractinium tetrahymenae]